MLPEKTCVAFFGNDPFWYCQDRISWQIDRATCIFLSKFSHLFGLLNLIKIRYSIRSSFFIFFSLVATRGDKKKKMKKEERIEDLILIRLLVYWYSLSLHGSGFNQALSWVTHDLTSWSVSKLEQLVVLVTRCVGKCMNESNLERLNKDILKTRWFWFYFHQITQFVGY